VSEDASVYLFRNLFAFMMKMNMINIDETEQLKKETGMQKFTDFKPVGYWTPGEETAAQYRNDEVYHVNKQVFAVVKDGKPVFVTGGKALLGEQSGGSGSLPLLAWLPAVEPEKLGDPDFCSEYGIRFPYIAGSMAHGISSAEMVEAMAEAGMLGFYGAAGLSVSTIEAAIDRLQRNLADKPCGFNLIHSPSEPRLEAEVADLYIRKGVKLVEASAFLDITLPLVKYRVHDIHRNSAGDIVAPNRIIAKVSRVELAAKFFSPPPETFLRELVVSGYITDEQAELARKIPMAQDITAEADSGGHTDNRPAMALIPTILALRDRMQTEYNYPQKLRVGAAGGISTPSSAAAAFAMGVAYIMTGSVNQACIESGTSNEVRELLTQAQQADVIMAPAADMFEMGVKVQVLKRGTMFPMRSKKLSDIYNSCGSIDEISAAERTMLEKNFFKSSLDEIWTQTCNYFMERDNTQITEAGSNPKHKMALIFRWYLGQASHWATTGDPSRKMDYQVWCGPAMGAFNEWTKDTFLENIENRKVALVALNLLYGAALVSRLNFMKQQGIQPAGEIKVQPLTEEQIREYIR
jgi:trans-AT polyketide synthase, acyltransferase and oxidoreductase domains